MEEIYKGIVIWFKNEKGFGFIKWNKDGSEQKDLFCHYSDIYREAESEGYRTLKKDQKVSFGIGLNKNGDLKAINVKVINETEAS